MDERNSQSKAKRYMVYYDGKETNPPFTVTIDGFYSSSSLLMDLDDIFIEWYKKSPDFDLEKLSFKKI